MLNFEDTETAFITKSNGQLKKAYWLFKLVANQKLVSFGKWSSALAMKIGLPIKGAVRSTVYEQFVGGETIDQCRSTINELLKHSVYSILDYSVEGAKSEADFESTTDKILETISFGANNGGVPFAVFKVTGIGRFGLLHKVSDSKQLTEIEQTEFDKIRKRVNRICEQGIHNGISILIDAEESWIQPAIDQLALEMILKYNLEKCLVYNTLQMYRWDRLDYLKELKEIANNKGAICGVKLVRGAYMEKERARAYDFGYSSPIQPNKAATDKDYDLAIEYCLTNYQSIGLVAGSHNEQSTKQLTELMTKNGVPKDYSSIWFSQLYGMSDHLSFNLAKEGYNVVKYLPFGPIEKTLPYLIRRAEENTSASGQTNRELNLIQKELRRRGMD